MIFDSIGKLFFLQDVQAIGKRFSFSCTLALKRFTTSFTASVSPACSRINKVSISNKFASKTFKSLHNLSSTSFLIAFLKFSWV